MHGLADRAIPSAPICKIFSGSGVVYAAQCEEKVMRAYIAQEAAHEQIFVNAARKRLCTEEGQRTYARSSDDTALTQG